MNNKIIFSSIIFIAFCLISSSTIFSHFIPKIKAQTNAEVIANISMSVNNTKITNENPDLNANQPTDGLTVKKDIKYFNGTSGYLVYPSDLSDKSSHKKVPAVIMIHEWWGINDNIRTMANTLAKQGGYVVLAVDLFNGKSTEDPNQAMQFVNSAKNNPQKIISNLKDAVSYLSSLPFVNSSKIASIGWCFGGGQSLQLALHSEDHPLVATILYYGTPLVINKTDLTKIKTPILGIFGDQDKSIPLSKIKSFESALSQEGIEHQIYVYKGLGHAFANPSGANYASKQTSDAWEKTIVFLKKYFE